MLVTIHNYFVLAKLRLSFCISVSVIHKALVTYPLSLVSLRIAAGLPRFCIHMYPICIYSPCMSPFFDQNYGSKSEPVLLLVWRYHAGNASRKIDCNNLLQIAEKTVAMITASRDL